MELYLAMLAGFGGMFGWGLADFFAKKTVDKIGDIKTLLWMQFLGSVPLGIYLAFNWTAANLSPAVLGYLFLFGIAGIAAYLLFYRGLQAGLVSILSPVFAAQSAIAVLVSVFIFGEAINPLKWFALGVTFIGIMLVTFQPQGIEKKLSLKNLSKGLLPVLIGMLIFGFYFPCWDWFLGYQAEGWLVSALLTRLIGVIALIVFLYVASRIKKTGVNIGVKRNRIWLWLVLIGLFDVMAEVSSAWGYRFTTFTSAVVMITGAFPLPTVILARIFLKEKLATNQIIGVAAIIAGLIILAL